MEINIQIKNVQKPEDVLNAFAAIGSASEWRATSLRLPEVSGNAVTSLSLPGVSGNAATSLSMPEV